MEQPSNTSFTTRMLFIKQETVEELQEILISKEAELQKLSQKYAEFHARLDRVSKVLKTEGQK